MTTSNLEEDKMADIKTESIYSTIRNKAFKEIVSHFPIELKKKFAALKLLANKRDVLRQQFDKEVCKIEEEYEAALIPLYKCREEIINGKSDPRPEELITLSQYTSMSKKVPKGINMKELEETKGVPGFWLRVFQNCKKIKDFIQPKDVPILKYLTNVSKVQKSKFSYEVVFTFAPNEYFSNSDLTKLVVMDPDDPDDCLETKGTTINWKENKDITKRIVTIKRRHKKTKEVKEEAKIVESASFFNYFNTRKSPYDLDIESIEEQERAEEVFEDEIRISETIWQDLIPEALLYYFDIAENTD